MILSLILQPKFCYSQNQQLDSLKKTLRVAKEDTTKLAILTSLIESINEDDVWVKYNDLLGPLSQKLMEDKNPVIVLNATKHYADFLNNKGYLLINLGDVKSALNYFHKSLKIQEEVGDMQGLAYSLNNLGYIYSTQNDLIRALNYYEKSLKIRERIADNEGIAQSLSNIGNLYDKAGNLTKALRYYQKALRIRQAIKDKLGQGYSFQIIGQVYETAGDKANALLFYNKSLKIRTEIGDTPGIAYSYSSLGNFYLNENKTDLALSNALASLDISMKLGYPKNIGTSAYLLQEIYVKQKKFDKAYEMLKLSTRMTDSIDNDEIRKVTLNKQFSYEYEKKEVIAKAQQEKKDFEYSEQINRNKVIISASIICLLIVIFFSIFLYRRIKIIKNQKLIIEKQTIEVDKQREIAVNRSIIAEKQTAIIEQNQKEIVDSITYAKRIQYALLAPANLLNKHLPEHFVFFKPKDIVSGDFYWAIEVKDKFYLAVCDSTGHGVPGAFMSLININFLNEAIIEKNISEPNEILNHVRNRLIENLSNDGGQDGMDAILLCFDKLEDTITYAAANSAPVIIRNNTALELPKDKMPVGKGEKLDSFTLFTLNHQKNDNLYLFTDGYSDQFGGPLGKKFKKRNLNEYLMGICNLPQHKQLEKLKLNHENWKTWIDNDGNISNYDQVDDICIVGIKI